MTQFTFEAEFRPGQVVLIKALDRTATVAIVRVDQGGIVDYLVTWWDEGKRIQEWLRDYEIREHK